MLRNTKLFITAACIWKGATDNNKAFGALLTDLSQVFDCLRHDLLIANLYAYGLDID